MLQRKLDYAQVFQNLVQGCQDFLLKTKGKNFVFGLSGGLDSALVAVIAKEAAGAEQVLAVLLPSEFTSQVSLDDANKLAENLGIKAVTQSIQPLFDLAKISLNEQFQVLGLNAQDNTEENLQSRIRAILLMAYSNKMPAFLLNTSNKSEIMVGYSTLYGDSCGALAVLGDLYKTEIFALSEWYNKTKGQEIIPQNIISRPPSAELRADQKDSDFLPDYAVLDPVLEKISLGQNLGNSKLEQEVLRLYQASDFKRKLLPPILAI